MSIHDAQNARYWQELCGTTAANSFGFDMSQTDGQDKFDNWYKDFYEYLFDYIDELVTSDSTVIEVGLGLGTLSRYLAQRSAEYIGVDISSNSCEFVQGTLQQRSLAGRTINKSIFDLSGEFESRFDIGLAIGSLHHTGNLKEAVKTLESFIKPGGKILIMVYNEFDLRRVLRRPLRTLRHALESLVGISASWEEMDSIMRGLNDADANGESAPHTAFSSKRFFYKVSNGSVEYEVSRKNFHDMTRFHKTFSRQSFLGWPSRLAGPDLYALGYKNP